MRISGDDEIRFALHRTGEKLIVCRVLSDSVGLVDILGDDGFSENQAEEAPEGFLCGLKSLLDPRIVEHPAHFFVVGDVVD